MTSPHSPHERSPQPTQVSAAGAWRWPILAALLLACVIVWRFGGGGSPHTPLHNDAAQPAKIAAPGAFIELEKRTISIVENARKSVAAITVYDRDQKVSSGSGIFWDAAGNVVTNWHVIRKALTTERQTGRDRILEQCSIFITRDDRTSVAARIVGVQPSNDLAVLKADFGDSECRPLPIGSAQDLKVGQLAFAIGNPYGYDYTLTTGCVSAFGRQIRSVTGQVIEGVIQTDAAINPGNSGGPLLDSSGRLIGITTSIHSPSGSSIGLGFAIPVDLVNRVVPQLIRGGTRAGLGIRVLGYRPAVARLMRNYGRRGVLISSVEKGKAAEKAGLRPINVDVLLSARNNSQQQLAALGDIIVGVNGVQISNYRELDNALRGLPTGTKVRLTVQRDGLAARVPIDVELCELLDPGT